MTVDIRQTVALGGLVVVLPTPKKSGSTDAREQFLISRDNRIASRSLKLNSCALLSCDVDARGMLLMLR